MSKNLNEAAMAGNLEEVVFRLNLGEDVNQMSNKNSTALHDATTCGRVQIVKILIERWVQYDCLSMSLESIELQYYFPEPRNQPFLVNTVWKLRKHSVEIMEI